MKKQIVVLFLALLSPLAASVAHAKLDQQKFLQGFERACEKNEKMLRARLRVPKSMKLTCDLDQSGFVSKDSIEWRFDERENEGTLAQLIPAYEKRIEELNQGTDLVEQAIKSGRITSKKEYFDQYISHHMAELSAYEVYLSMLVEKRVKVMAGTEEETKPESPYSDSAE